MILPKATMGLRGILCVWLLVCLWPGPARPQEQPGEAPVIIRDTDIAEGVQAERPPREQDPREADRNVDVGNFYHGRGNYVGAIGRYLDALEYNPDSDRAAAALARAYQSLVGSLASSEDAPGLIRRAVHTFETYLRNNPDSARFDDILEKTEALRERGPSPP